MNADRLESQRLPESRDPGRRRGRGWKQRQSSGGGRTWRDRLHIEESSLHPAGGLTKFENETLSRVAYPLGGIGAGMICLEGTGRSRTSRFATGRTCSMSLVVFAALAVQGPKATARVLEGPVPGWKIFGMPNSGLGEGEHAYGFPRFRNASFAARFPFGTVSLSDPDMPVTVELTGWSPFTPGDANNSSLPVIALGIPVHEPDR